MTRVVTSALLFLSLVLGCAPLKKEETQAPKVPEPTPASISSTPKEATSDQASPAGTLANPTHTREEIRMLQARLKAAGFYVGPIDGIPGPKTRSGILRLQAACASLKDLLESSAAANQTGNLDSTSNSRKSEDIRLIQVRLKDAGFDPGPIDGISGTKTTGALLRFEAGCTMLKNLQVILDKEPQTNDKLASLARGEKSYPTAAKSVGFGSDIVSVSGNQKIRQEQLRLRDAGFDPGPIDGILGPKTKAATQRYQKSLSMKNPL